jgi:hypothetical protein
VRAALSARKQRDLVEAAQVSIPAASTTLMSEEIRPNPEAPGGNFGGSSGGRVGSCPQ